MPLGKPSLKRSCSVDIVGDVDAPSELGITGDREMETSLVLRGWAAPFRGMSMGGVLRIVEDIVDGVGEKDEWHFIAGKQSAKNCWRLEKWRVGAGTGDPGTRRCTCPRLEYLLSFSSSSLSVGDGSLPPRLRRRQRQKSCEYSSKTGIRISMDFIS